MTPVCVRCGQPVIGPRTIGAAEIEEGWVCGFDSTIEEERAHLLAKLRSDR